MHISVVGVWAFLHEEGAEKQEGCQNYFKYVLFKMHHRVLLQL